MNKILKRVMTTVGAGVLALSLLAPVTEVSAASKNKAAEIPVNFTNSGWEDDWDTTSKTEASFWDFGEPASYSESYTVSYKLYIPVSFMKAESTVCVGGSLNFNDASEEEWKYAGYSELPSVEMHEDASLTVWDDAQQKDVPVDYATVKKTGKAVISVKANGKTVKVTVTVKKK